jgi:TPR repeat protein
MLYDRGDVVPRNLAIAYEWYLRAAHAGSVDAQNCLGGMVLEGSGVIKDLTQAKGWFLKAAGRGDSRAFFNLGQVALTGSDPDPVDAHAWFNLASAAGDSDAKAALRRIEGQMTRDQIEKATKVARERHSKFAHGN